MSRKRSVLLSLLALLVARPVSAWEIEDPIHQNCHERLTAAALAAVGYRGGEVPPPPEGDDAVFFDRQQFDASRYPRNLDALALILGVRSNDTRGLPDFDFDALAAASNDDADQPAHCLRRRYDDGAAGDERALARCRDFIEGEVEQALRGVAPDGRVDPAATEDVEVFIPYVGTIRWPLSRFYFHAGRALHALQDAFTHTYRDPTWHRVLAVQNWVDAIRGDLVEARDGHPHETLLDQCDTPRPWREAQLDAAAAATAALYGVLATADPQARDATFAAVTAVLDDWLTYAPGCTLENRYCDNEVHADLIANGLSDGTSAGGCSVAGGGAGAGAAAALLALLGLLGLGRGRRRAAVLGRERRRVTERRRRRAAALGLGLAVLLGAAATRAQAPASASAPAQVRAPAPAPERAQPPAPAPAPASEPPRSFSLQGLVRAGASVTEAAFAVGGGAVLTWRRVDFELGLEWNPWISVERGETASGSLNLYLLAAWRWPVSPRLDLESGVGAGLAILLFETVGTPPGNVGPYLAVRPLGVTRRFGRRLALTVNAFELAVPIPQTRGWPFSHPQYRASVGLRF